MINKRLFCVFGCALLAIFAGQNVVTAGSESKIKKQLVKGLKTSNKEKIIAALAEAAALPGTKGTKLILSKALPIGALGLVADLVEALKNVEDPTELVKAATRHKKSDIRYLAVRGLTNRKDEKSRKAILKALNDKSEAVAVAAVRACQAIVTKEIVETLIEALEKDEKARARKKRPALAREVITALKNVTEQDIDYAEDWRNYWSAHRDVWRAPEAVTGSDKDVIERMKRHRRSDVRTLERLGKTDVIVIRGSSDKVERVLKAIQIEHKIIKLEQFDDFKLNPSSVLVLNCNGNREFSEAGLKKLDDFVSKGGYMFSSDWQLKNTLEKVFPKTIAFGGKTKRTEKGEEEVVPIVPAVPNHAYMRDVFPLSTIEQAGFCWKVDSTSHLIKILDQRVVIPLIACKELYPGNPFMAVTFRWNGQGVAIDRRAVTGQKSRKLKGGAVMHVLGHFKNQKNESDKFALQQLLLNFILEKQREKRIAGR